MTAFQGILEDRAIRDADQIEDVLKIVRPNFRFVRSKQIRYFNVPASFDIETSSWKDDRNQKHAAMYVWQFCLYGAVLMGRTWDELVTMLTRLSTILDLSPDDKRLIVYVHNLGYEFQFMRKHFVFSSVFATQPREPIYAVTDLGIEFRDSYILSGASLAYVGEHLHKYKVRKLSGDLDYTLIRTWQTPLTRQEIAYCVNDVKVVCAYIMEQIEMNEGSIARIPLTKTGYVRRYCRDACFYVPGEPKAKSKKRLKYRDVIKHLTMTPDEYKQLKRAFQGGFTHANPFCANQVIADVTSYDFTSSYPAVLVAEQFPMSPAQIVVPASEDEFRRYLDLYCCLFDITLYDVKPKLWQDNPISVSRCHNVINDTLSNGRVVSADQLTTTVTEQDYYIYERFYTWSRKDVFNMRIYMKDYLPTDFVKSILTLYENKTKLKGIAEREVEYLLSKEMLNSCYGMCVTDMIKDEQTYDNEDGWGVEKVNVAEALEKYNNDPNRFLFYPWGVWTTAYARRNLFYGIVASGNDYVYSDTDSIKITHAADHTEFIESYNKLITEQIRTALIYHRLDPDAASPETIAGKRKQIGVWDDDGHYKRFKTLGAKRYLGWSGGNHYNLTVAGLGKRSALDWMLKRYGRVGIFREFRDGMTIPRGYSGRPVHTYIDTPYHGYLTDYLGNSAYVEEETSIHLEESEYTMGLEGFIYFITGLDRSLIEQ